MRISQKVGEKREAGSLLAASISMGTVELNIRDLPKMKKFYAEVIGLDVMREDHKSIMLGSEKTQIIKLIQRDDLSLSRPSDAGLYHMAIVFASRNGLAQTLQRVLVQSPHLFSGSADHLVSEAFYLSDPEGNGIELYFDRDPSNWKWENKMIQMASKYLDPQEYVQKNSKNGDAEKKHIGHVHLKVGDIEEARRFYVDGLGFDVTSQLSGALFVSVGGYHHHLGINNWESAGAGKRTEMLGLKQFELILPTQQDLKSLKQRLNTHRISFEENTRSVSFADPWNNEIMVRV